MSFSLYCYNCTLIRVIDGDTIVAMVDLGFSTWKKVTIRLLDIDTPELRSRNENEKILANKAKDRLAELLSSGEFILISDSVDSFGRSLGRVYTTEFENVAATLIAEGLGKEYKK